MSDLHPKPASAPRKKATPAPSSEHDPSREPGPGDHVISCPLLGCDWTYVLPPLTAAAGALSTLLGTEVTIPDPKRVERDLEAHCKTHTFTEWAAAVVGLQQVVDDTDFDLQSAREQLFSAHQMVDAQREHIADLRKQLENLASLPARTSGGPRVARVPQETEEPRLARGAAAEQVTPRYNADLQSGVVGIKR